MSQRAGWYDDPENPGSLRYFDGVVWTSHTTPRAAPSAAPVPPATQPLQTGPPLQYGGPQPYAPMPQAYPPAGYAGALGGPTTPDGVPLASYGQRAGAYLLDALILGVVSALFSSYWLYRFVQWYVALINDMIRQAEGGGQPTVDQTSLQGEVMGYLWPIVVVTLLVHLLYNTFFLMRTGATPGKMAVGIAVRLRERPGALGLVDALKRQAIEIGLGILGFVPFISLFTSLAWVLDLLWPLWDVKRQALHDKIAGTNVVVKPRER